jgi:hypothetical protein
MPAILSGIGIRQLASCRNIAIALIDPAWPRSLGSKRVMA